MRTSSSAGTSSSLFALNCLPSTNDEDFLLRSRREGLTDGTTVLLALTFDAAAAPIRSGRSGGGSAERTLVVANAGDCRAVMCRSSGLAVRLSDDHKPGRPDERRRITSAGGSVVDLHGVTRVTTEKGAQFLAGSGRAGAGGATFLSVSRGFGDIALKQPHDLVTATPDVVATGVGEDDCFLIVACDGIWDVLSDQEACDCALVALTDCHASAEQAATAVVREAFKRGSQDNLTATCLLLQPDLDGEDSAAAAAGASSSGGEGPSDRALAKARQGLEIREEERVAYHKHVQAGEKVNCVDADLDMF